MARNNQSSAYEKHNRRHESGHVTRMGYERDSDLRDSIDKHSKIMEKTAKDQQKSLNTIDLGPYPCASGNAIGCWDSLDTSQHHVFKPLFRASESESLHHPKTCQISLQTIDLSSKLLLEVNSTS